MFASVRAFDPHFYNANAARSTIGRQPHFGYHLVIRIVGNYLDQHNRKICPLLFVTFLPVMVDGEHAAGIFARVLEVARLESECLDDGDWRVWTSIRTPGGIEFPRSVSLQSILRRAVFTGITPGESARLTGEELAGLLLRVWKTESK